VNRRLHEQHLDVAQTTRKGHGRHERHHLEASTRLAGHLDWPGLEQVCRLTRTTRRGGKWTSETDYAITSVPRSLAGAPELLRCWQRHWDIENRSHYVRDATFQEDACRIRTGSAPQNLAALRNAAIALLRLHVYTNLAAALRDCTWKTQQLLAMLGIFKKE
jgi:hypothetical protein